MIFAVLCMPTFEQVTTDDWVNRGNAFDSQGNFDEAIKACNEAIKLDSKYAGAWFNKDMALYNLGKYDEAIAAFDKVIELENPQNAEVIPSAWNYKGLALKSLGRTAEANAAFLKAMELGYEN